MNPAHMINLRERRNVGLDKWVRDGIPYVTFDQAEFMNTEFVKNHDRMELEEQKREEDIKIRGNMVPRKDVVSFYF